MDKTDRYVHSSIGRQADDAVTKSDQNQLQIHRL